MIDQVNFTGPGQSVKPSSSPQGAPAAEPAGRDFKSILLNSLNEVDRLQSEAEAGVQRLLTGESDNVAEVLSAANKAGIAFDLLMEVRNKLTEAYQEIQQMRV
ncbi:MAG: flagellar hook-basal body complex protein FliE [Phycisphaerae bacterium]